MNTHVTGLTTEALLAEAHWVRGLALHLTRNPAEAEDVAQETLLRAIDRPPAEAPAPRAWLATVAANLVRSARRQDRIRRLEPLTGQEPPGAQAGPGGSPEQLVERMQTQRLLADLLLGLAEPFREVVLLRYIEGLSSAQIARRLNVPAGTVRWRLKNGLDNLRRDLDRAHGGERERWHRMLIPFAALAPESYRQDPQPIQPRASSPAVAAFVVPGLALLAVLLGWGLVRLALGPVNHQAGQLATGDKRGGPSLLAGAVSPAVGDGVLVGRVLDDTGRGVPGAVVTALSRVAASRWKGQPFTRAPVPTAVAGPDGGYRLTGLAPGKYGLSAHGPGRGLAVHSPLDVAGEGQPVTLDLILKHPGARARGQVLDESGGPVPGARLLAFVAQATEDDTDVLVQTRSDAQGRYELELPSRSSAVQADAAGYAAEMQSIDLEGLAEVVQDLRLLPAARLAGTVMVKGEPTAGAQVDVDPEDDAAPEPLRLVTDASGRFLAEGLAPGRYRVTARQGSLVGAPVEPVSVGGGQLREMDALALVPGGTIRGRVAGPQGGVAEADVILEQERSGVGPNRQLGLTRTDAGGMFVFEGLRPGTYDVQVSATGWLFREVPVVVAGTAATSVRVEVARAARVTGLVLGPDGMGVAAADVQARVHPRDQNFGFGDRRRSGPDGRFVLHNLGAGKLHVVAMHDQAIAVAGPVDLVADGEAHLTLRLVPGARVSGVVRTTDGKPVAAMRVTGRLNRDTYTRPAAVRTDAQGRYGIGPFLDGQVSIVLVPPGNQIHWSSEDRPEQKDLELKAGEHRQLDFVLPLARLTLAGRLLGPNGEPQVGVVVQAGIVKSLDDPWLGERRAVTDGDGNFLLEGLQDAPHALRAAHPEWPMAYAAGIRPGTKDTVLHYALPAVLFGQVRDATGRPPPDFRLMVMPHQTPDDRSSRGNVAGDPLGGLALELSRIRMEVRDGSGQFALPRLPAGKVDIHVITGDGRTGRVDALDLVAGKQHRVKITLQPAVTVRGRVVQGDQGTPAVGWPVRVLAARQWFTTSTDGAGRFVLPGLFGESAFWGKVSPPDGDGGDGFVVYRDRGADQDLGTLRVPLQMSDELSPGLVGMRAERRPEGLVVFDVTPGLPAARAGLMSGDRLLAVDGRPVGDLGPWGLAQRLRGAPGSAIRLTFERPGQPQAQLNLVRVAAPKQ